MVKFVNLTPHVIRIQKDKDIINIKPSGTVAQVSIKERVIGEIDGIPVIDTTVSKRVKNLPHPEKNTVYIVSSIVSAVLGNKRPDVVAPDTGTTAIRFDDGTIFAVTRLRKGGLR